MCFGTDCLKPIEVAVYSLTPRIRFDALGYRVRAYAGALTSPGLLGLFGRTLRLKIANGSSIQPIRSLPQVKLSLKPCPGVTSEEVDWHTQKRELKANWRRYTGDRRGQGTEVDEAPVLFRNINVLAARTSKSTINQCFVVVDGKNCQMSCGSGCFKWAQHRQMVEVDFGRKSRMLQHQEEEILPSIRNGVKQMQSSFNKNKRGGKKKKKQLWWTQQCQRIKSLQL